MVLGTLSCLYPNYKCCQFSGTFTYDGRGWRPDIAVIAKDLSHWFVVEVELATHSLNSHVLPQVTAFKLGNYESDCITQLVKRTGSTESVIRGFLQTGPRHVAVIANKYSEEWDISLRAHQIQLATVELFSNINGEHAYQMNGGLVPQEKHLGVGKYSATDRSIVATSKIRIGAGSRWIVDLDGHEAEWKVKEQNGRLWITKKRGVPMIPDGVHLQILQTDKDGLRLRML